jgi:hypothetical protein
VRVMRLGRVLYPTQAVEWLFPADSVSGHLAEHKEDRGTLASGATIFAKPTGQWDRPRALPISISTYS